MPTLPCSCRQHLVFCFHLASAVALSISEEDRRLICDGDAAPFPPAGGQVRWLHVPKTGTSFANTVWHYGCPDMADDVSVAAYDRRFENEINERYPLEKWCPRLVDHTPGTHKPIGVDEWAQHEGHFVALLREPAARMSSAYSFLAHHCVKDCNPENAETAHQGACSKVRDPLRQQSSECTTLHASRCLADYASSVPAHGCASKMILGYPCNGNTTLSSADIVTAVQRLRRGFSFVGLVEEWDLSLCMFHRLMGGTPLPVEFAHVRGNEHHEGPTDCPPSRGEDPVDEPLYAAAREIFEAQVSRVLAQLHAQASPAAPRRAQGFLRPGE